MDTSESTSNGHRPRPDEVDELPDGWHWSVYRVLGIAAFLIIAIFWIWAFANRDSIPHPDEFDDASFVSAAEAICAPRQAEIASYVNPTTLDRPEERAELVQAGTEQLEQMIAELKALPLPADAQAAATIPRWIADYELYLQDRRDWTEDLFAGEDTPFTISGNEDGVRVTDLVQTFAEVNGMDSCAPSQDA